jgi:hypothetical protein
MRPRLTCCVRYIHGDLQVPVRGKRAQDQRSQRSSKVFCRRNHGQFGSGRKEGQAVGGEE